MENITGQAVTKENYLYTRLYLIDDLKELIQRSSVIIEAPRRFGKTSLIKELMRQELEKSDKNKQFNVLFLELEGEESINDFCFKLFKELLNLYRVRKCLELLGNFLGDAWNIIASRLKKASIPEIEFEIREKTRDFNFTDWKVKISSMIMGLNKLDKKTIIVFDEFPDMLMNFKNKIKEPEAFKIDIDRLTGWLRSIRQNQDKNKYQFVFCGSINLRKTLEDLGISKRINDLEPLIVPPLKKDEAACLIDALIKTYNLEITEDGISFMISKITNGSPYYGQILIKAFRDTREKSFNSEMSFTIYENMLKGGNNDLNHFHTRLEEYLSPLEKECIDIILKKLCAEHIHEKELYDLFIYDKYDYTIFQAVTNRLIYEGYIMRDINNKGVLRFISPMLKDWWAYKAGVK